MTSAVALAPSDPVVDAAAVLRVIDGVIDVHKAFRRAICGWMCRHRGALADRRPA